MILLVLLLIFNGPNGTTHDGEMIIRGHLAEDGTKTPFADMDDCQKKAAELVAAAQKDPSEVRSISATCINATLTQIGQGV